LIMFLKHARAPRICRLPQILIKNLSIVSLLEILN